MSDLPNKFDITSFSCGQRRTGKMELVPQTHHFSRNERRAEKRQLKKLRKNGQRYSESGSNVESNKTLCNDCGIPVNKSFPMHVCRPERMVTCQFCKLEIQFQNSEEHVESCFAATLEKA